MKKTQTFDFILALIGLSIAIILLATSCSNYGNRCLRPGELNGAGRTVFNK